MKLYCYFLKSSHFSNMSSFLQSSFAEKKSKMYLELINHTYPIILLVFAMFEIHLQNWQNFQKRSFLPLENPPISQRCKTRLFCDWSVFFPTQPFLHVIKLLL